MKYILENLEPKSVFRFFEEISNIPRGSGNEKAVSNYLVEFAKERNLEVIQDEAYNVIIKKPGTKGYENAPTVIIQGHMDMVCDKNKSKVHDFEKDPIELRIIDDYIYASDTTLGADDGIAVAYGLAILDSKDISHPPLEVLITTDEEVGMRGAIQLNPENLKGEMLINIDSEEEGYLLVGCAGGIRTEHRVPVIWEDSREGLVPYNISVMGLRGGHSGVDINKGRGNANKLMGRVLSDISEHIDFYMREINGGQKSNAIPRESDALILVSPDDVDAIKKKVDEWNFIFKNEFRVSDPDVKVVLEKVEQRIDMVFSKDTLKKVISALVLIPNGVITMSMDIAGLVESSSNIGVVKTANDYVKFESAVRSSIKSLKYNILNQAKTVARALNMEFEDGADYPEWQYNPDSKIRDICIKVYDRMYGKKPEVIAIHAGLECGLFKEKMPHLDMISFGPDMYDVHTPNEHISISSIKRTYEYLLEVLKEIK